MWCTIESKENGLVLAIEEGKCGGKIITSPKHGGDDQLWTWKENSLVSKTGYAMEVEGSNSSAGTNAISWDHDGGQNQQWRVEGDKIISVLNGFALAIKDGSNDAGADIILWPRHANDGPVNNQSWQFVMKF